MLESLLKASEWKPFGDMIVFSLIIWFPGIFFSKLLFKNSGKERSLISYIISSQIIGILFLCLFGIFVFQYGITRRTISPYFWQLYGLVLFCYFFIQKPRLRDLYTLLLPLLLGMGFGFIAMPTWQGDSNSLSISFFTSVDHKLQYIVAHNLYKGGIDHIDGGFLSGYPTQIWSSGDRPMLMGLVTATFSVIRKTFVSVASYHFIFYYCISFLFVALAGILLKVKKIGLFLFSLIVAVILFQPYLFLNYLYTWPKMSGLSFLMGGYYFLHLALSSKKHFLYALLGGLGCALGMVSHGTIAIGFLCVCLLLMFEKGAKLWPEKVRVIGLSLIAIVPIWSFQSWVIKNKTNSSDLLKRVALCRTGSFARPTPPMSLSEACVKYFEKRGLSGVWEDRMKSLNNAFKLDYHKYSDFSGYLDRQSRYRGKILSPIFAYGIWHQWIAIFSLLFFAAQIIRRKWTVNYGLVLLNIGFLGIIIFGLIMGEHSEVRSMQIPMSQYLFISVGALIFIWQLNRWLSYAYAVALICLYLYIDTSLVNYKFSQLTMLGLAMVWGGTILVYLMDKRAHHKLKKLKPTT